MATRASSNPKRRSVIIASVDPGLGYRLSLTQTRFRSVSIPLGPCKNTHLTLMQNLRRIKVGEKGIQPNQCRRQSMVATRASSKRHSAVLALVWLTSLPTESNVAHSIVKYTCSGVWYIQSHALLGVCVAVYAGSGTVASRDTA